MNGLPTVGFQPCHSLESEKLWRLSKDQEGLERTEEAEHMGFRAQGSMMTKVILV